MARPRPPIPLKPINPKWTSVGRQQLRADIFRLALAEMMKRYGGESRRTLRVLARALAHTKWKDRRVA